MEIVYYIIFSIFISLPANSLPIPEDNNGVSHYYGKLTEPFVLSIGEESLAHSLRKREISQDAGKTNELEDSSDIAEDVDNKQASQDNIDNKQASQDGGDSLEGSETRNYRPYFRFQKISRTRYTRPKYPLSNYANDRDRFPTTF